MRQMNKLLQLLVSPFLCLGLLSGAAYAQAPALAKVEVSPPDIN